MRLAAFVTAHPGRGYGMVGLAGRAYDRSAEGKPDALYGNVSERGCGKFALERE